MLQTADVDVIPEEETDSSEITACGSSYSFAAVAAETDVDLVAEEMVLVATAACGSSYFSSAVAADVDLAADAMMTADAMTEDMTANKRVHVIKEGRNLIFRPS